jgi:myosin heavy subunit
VLTEDGENHVLDPKASQFCEECNPEAMDSQISDLVNISDLNEMSILHNLRIRFKEDKIYTNISSILISVNPFKLLPLYTPAVLDSYRNGSRGMPPHVFGIAVNAYNNMLSYSENQAVVCSGESGAGKSEATKLILQFLTDVSSKATATTSKENPTEGNGVSKSSTLEKQILGANPILEAFGNAKTLRNNNSSRFGKLITINFDRNGSIIGGGIINYLLEKSRIVTQTQGERNYHIFYQLLTASETDAKLTAQLKLQAPDLFIYTSQSGVNHVEGISDDKDFDEMRNSLSILRFTDDMQNDVFRIVAGVLHFGNVKFRVKKNDNAEDGSEVANPEVLAHAASLWGVDAVELEKFLTFRSMGGKELILVAYSQNQAQDARDAMCKQVYADLFQFLVDKINIELSTGSQQRHSFIGVLDIFGFEHFEVNSFEQLCINYCNEKLQFHFNEHIFRMEQTLYKEEGIIIPGTAFVDNQPTLDLLELKPTGIFSMIDEEINVPRGSDDTLLQKILTRHAKHPNCVKPKPRECKDALKNFGVAHYAGIVFYNVTNFLEKNKDQLHGDIVNVLAQSSMPMVQGFFPQDPVEVDGAKKKPTAKKTLGMQFKAQLNDLVATLNSTFPHFVRCMKSNDLKKGGLFTSSRMQDQLRYAGLVEVCRIRKLGYPVRRPFDEFFKRYRCIDLLTPNLDTLLATLESRGILQAGEWAKGHTKVFCRTAQSGQLEYAREQSLTKVATIVQKNARRMIARRKYKSWKKILESVAAAMVARVEEPLAKVIDLAFELPNGGAHLQVIKQAKLLLARLREEKRVSQLLEQAIESRNIDSLKSAIAVHAAVTPPFDTPLADKAKTLLKRLEDELAIRAALIAAIGTRNKATIEETIQRCVAMDYTCNELTQAQALVARLEREAALIAQLRSACAAENLDEINSIYSACMEQGMNTYYGDALAEALQVKQVILARIAAEEAERKRREEEEERQRAALAAIEAKRYSATLAARQHLSATISSKDVNKINTVLEETIQAGYNFPEIEEARSMLESLKNIDDVKSQLAASIKTLEVQAESGINQSDLQPLARAIAVAQKVFKALCWVYSENIGSKHFCVRWCLGCSALRRVRGAARCSGHDGRL